MDKITLYWKALTGRFGPRITVAVMVGGAVVIMMLIAAVVGG
jgi:hypothetical protein